MRGREVALVALAVMCGVGAINVERLPDIPSYVRCAQEFYNLMNATLVSEMSDLRGRVDSVSHSIAQCGLEDLETGPRPLDAVDNEVLRDISARLSEIDTALSKILNAYDTEELLDGYFIHVERKLEEVKQTCVRNDSMAEVLQEVERLKRVMEQNERLLQEVKEEVEQRNTESSSNKVKVNVKMDALGNQLSSMTSLMGEKFKLLAGLGSQVLSLAQLAGPLMSQGGSRGGSHGGSQGSEESQHSIEPTTEATVYPCEDSTFEGTNSEDVCTNAVRFAKCYLPTVSYHCCRTCTSEGQLPDMGPWRYEQRPRRVTTLDVMRFFTL